MDKKKKEVEPPSLTYLFFSKCAVNIRNDPNESMV